MERQQRRSDFRMETPPETILQFETRDKTVVLDLINISLSGTLGALAKTRKSDRGSPILKAGDILTHLQIVLPADENEETARVEVKRAAVRRMEYDSGRDITRYGIEFLSLNSADRRALVQFIYQLQRQFLRRNIGTR
jgi:c-di-GMP-binding flagellar brake protein YcgR